MAIPFETARVKLARAKQHLEAFEDAVAAYRASNPHRVAHENDPATGHHRFTLTIVKRPTNLMAVLVGDCAHNLRCALDHVAWTLAGSNYADTATQFPIFEDPGKFNPRQIAAIPRRPQAVIKWLQPYRRAIPKADPLWHIHALDAADKHKLLIPALDIAEEVEPNIEAPPYSRVRFEIEFTMGPFVEDAVVAEGPVIAYPLKGGQPNTDVKVNIDFTFGVAIREPFSGITLLPAQLVLRDALNCAERVVGMFERYL